MIAFGGIFGGRNPLSATTTTALPDGRTIQCVNPYEVDFSVHEIFSEDFAAHGIDLPAEGVYFDVGANIGLFAIYLRDRCAQGRIFAYEPMPAAFAALAGNAAALTPPAEAIPLGLGRAPGTLEFDYFPGISALSTANRAVGEKLSAGLREVLAGSGASEAVREIVERIGTTERMEEADFLDSLFRTERVTAEIDTLSSQLAARGLAGIDLLKIDTEGAEKEVLAGIAESDWPKIRQLLVEVHLGRDETEAIEADLKRRGYRTSIGGHPLSQGGAPVFHIYASRGATGGKR